MSPNLTTINLNTTSLGDQAVMYLIEALLQKEGIRDLVRHSYLHLKPTEVKLFQTEFILLCKNTLNRPLREVFFYKYKGSK